jgi:hypothetical protein
MQNGASTLLPSATESHGFCGTVRQHAEPHHAWVLAIDAVATATSASEEAVRAFLASRSGRHFGDEVDGVVERWMELRITPVIETEIGIPEGLP